MYIFGADPGATGGIVLLEDDGDILNWWPMVGDDPKKGSYIDAVEEASILKKTSKILWAVEVAQAMPGNGACSMFTYGMGYGKLLGALEISSIPVQPIRPAKWTKEMLHGLPANLEGKNRNIQAARNLAPDFISRITPRSKPHLGLVDAYLIAEYGRRNFT